MHPPLVAPAAVVAFDLDLLVERAGERLLRTAVLLVGDTSAPDLVQVALSVVWTKRAAIGDLGSAEAYARRVMARQAASWWRRRWTRERPTEVLPDTGTHDGDVAQALAVRAALATLSRRERAVLVLRYLDDLTEERTAEVLGCSVGSVKAASRRGLERLRSQDWEGF